MGAAVLGADFFTAAGLADAFCAMGLTTALGLTLGLDATFLGATFAAAFTGLATFLAGTADVFFLTATVFFFNGWHGCLSPISALANQLQALL